MSFRTNTYRFPLTALVVLALALSSFTAWAQTPAPVDTEAIVSTMILDGDPCDEGSTLTVRVFIESNPTSLTAIAADFRVSYTAAALEFVRAEALDLGDVMWGDVEANGPLNEIDVLTNSNPTNVLDTPGVYDLLFMVLPGGPKPYTICVNDDPRSLVNLLASDHASEIPHAFNCGQTENLCAPEPTPTPTATPTPSPTATPSDEPAVISTAIVDGNPCDEGTTFTVRVAVETNPSGLTPIAADLRVLYTAGALNFIRAEALDLGDVNWGDEESSGSLAYRDVLTLSNPTNASLTPDVFDLIFYVIPDGPKPITVCLEDDPRSLVNLLASDHQSEIPHGFNCDRTTDLCDVTPTPTPTPTVTPTPTETPEPTPTETPTPTPTMTPCPDPVLDVEYDFTVDADGWTTGAAPFTFTATTFSVNPGSLQMGPSEFFTFGFWQSPTNAIPDVSNDELLAVRMFYSTDIADQCTVPTVRVRTNAVNQGQANVMDINSAKNCENAPDADGNAYTVIYRPQHDGLGSDHFMSFDWLFFDPFDAGNEAGVRLDRAEVFRIAACNVEGNRTLVRQYTFDTDEEGWRSGGAFFYFTDPVFEYTGGGLKMTATTRVDTYGFWNSLPTDVSTASGVLYVSDVTVVTDLGQDNGEGGSPRMRFRYLLDNAEGAQLMDVPIREAFTRTYEVYYLPPQHIEGSDQDGLVLAIDYLGFDPFTADGINVELTEWSLYTVPIPVLP